MFIVSLIFIPIFRPFFTYWVTFVQVVIYVIAVAVYGIAPPGFEETEITAEVCRVRSVQYWCRSKIQTFYQPQNLIIFIGGILIFFT